MKVNYVNAVNDSRFFVSKKQTLREENPVPQEDTVIKPENYGKNYVNNSVVLKGYQCGDIMNATKTVANANLGDKIAAGLKNLSPNEFLLLANDSEAVMNAIKTAKILLKPVNVYYIEHTPCRSSLLFNKNNEGEIKLTNLGKDYVNISGRKLEPYSNCVIKPSDLIYDYSIAPISVDIYGDNIKELVKCQMLFLNQLDGKQIAEINSVTNFSKNKMTKHEH